MRQFESRIPKTIYLWNENRGEDMPRICMYSKESFVLMNPDYEVKFISSETFNDYIDISYNWIFNIENRVHIPDLVGLLILSKYGGIYTHSTTLCCQKIDVFMEENRIDGFFTYMSNLEESSRDVMSWLIFSSPENELVTKWCQNALNNFKNSMSSADNLCNDALKDILKKDETCLSIFNGMTKMDGKMQSITSEIIHLDINSAEKICKTFAPGSHPLNLKERVDKKKFFITRLGHNELNNNFDLPNTLFTYLCRSIGMPTSKIILVGFPKSGTTSFHQMFLKNGIKSSHWKIGDKFCGDLIKTAKSDGKRLLSYMDNYEAYTELNYLNSKKENGWPQITELERLYRENKHSLFILNTRNIDSLFRSMQAWNDMDKRLLRFSPEIFSNVPKNLSEDEQIKYMIREHYNNVECFFKNQKNAKFVKFELESGDLSEIKKYLNLEGGLPRANKNRKNK